MRGKAVTGGTPPEGWLVFGSHAVLDGVPALTFSEETDPDDGLPLWERHDDCTCSLSPVGTCVVCGARIGWIECPTGGWWAHEVHPADNHDAQPQEGR